MIVLFVQHQPAFCDRRSSRQTWFATLFSEPVRCGMPIAFRGSVRSSVRPDERVYRKYLIMTATSCEPLTLPASFEFRLRFAHRIAAEIREKHKSIWTPEDLGTLLLEVLEEEFRFDWSQPDAVESFKEYLALAYVAAGHVLPASQRTF
jgi:hypothetical protein